MGEKVEPGARQDGPDRPAGPQIEFDLQERIRFEELVSDLSARFVNLPPEKLDQEIETSLRSVVEFLQADRGILWAYDRGESRFPDHALLEG